MRGIQWWHLFSKKYIFKLLREEKAWFWSNFRRFFSLASTIVIFLWNKYYHWISLTILNRKHIYVNQVEQTWNFEERPLFWVMRYLDDIYMFHAQNFLRGIKWWQPLSNIYILIVWKAKTRIFLSNVGHLYNKTRTQNKK